MTPTVKELVQRGESLAALGWRIIDAHGHLGHLGMFYAPTPDAADMVAMMDRLGVQTVCISSHLSIGSDFIRGNDETAQAARRFPGRIKGYVTINARYPEQIEGELRRGVDELGLFGIKLHPGLHDFSVLDPACEPIWRFAQERGLLVLAHTWGGDARCRPAAFGKLAESYPGVRFLLGHSGGVHAGREEAIQVAQAHPNIYLELCSSWLSRAEVEWMAAEVGAERMLFGTDMPFIDPRYTLGRVALANLSEEELRLILGENMARLLM